MLIETPETFALLTASVIVPEILPVLAQLVESIFSFATVSVWPAVASVAN
jgi:hypothetical protein